MFGEFSIQFVIGFFAVVFTCLFIDLKAHKADKPVNIRDAAVWSAIWISVAMGFACYIGVTHGGEKASLFLAGYFLEKSLSVDNLFVIMAIFSSFAIKEHLQHRVLYYGIIGALVMRMVFIGFGTALAAASEWVLVAFGLFVLWSAYKMATADEAEGDVEDYSEHFVVKWTKKIMPVTSRLHGHSFFVKEAGKWAATPLLLTLLVVETADVMFAFDSVPAVIAITPDPVIVYTSNIFAILGLRSLFFLLVAAKSYLIHLEKAVVAILIFIGAKMIVGTLGWVHISANMSLAVVLGGLVLGIGASVLFPDKEKAKASV
jgi:tellurite resistance protein TerC